MDENEKIPKDEPILVEGLKLAGLGLYTCGKGLLTIFRMVYKLPFRIVLVGVVVVAAIWYLQSHRAPDKLPKPTVVATGNSQISPLLLSTDTFTVINTPVPTITPLPTSTPLPTATPNPWRAARGYNPGSAEISVPVSGVACRGSDFTVDGDWLVISQNGVELGRIKNSDPLFAIGSRWAIFNSNNWGVTYLDPSKQTGQSAKISDWIGFVIDDHGCITHP